MHDYSYIYQSEFHIIFLMLMIKDLILISNLLSVIRILLVPVVMYYLSLDDGTRNAVIFTIIAILTDYFDGLYARKFNQVTELGKIIDPLADKIAVAGVLLALVLFRDFPLWALMLILLRDVIILLFGIYVMKTMDYVPSSNMLGKITVLIYAFLILSYMINIESIKLYVLCLSLLLLFLSLFGYYKTVLKK